MIIFSLNIIQYLTLECDNIFIKYHIIFFPQYYTFSTDFHFFRLWKKIYPSNLLNIVTEWSINSIINNTVSKFYSETNEPVYVFYKFIFL